MRRREVASALIASAAGTALPGRSSAGSAGPAIYARSPAETAAAVRPVHPEYPPGWLPRYGDNSLPGSTDMSAALASALSCNSVVYVPAWMGPCHFADLTPFNLVSGQTVCGDGPATRLTFASNATSNLQCSGVSGAAVCDLSIRVTGRSKNTYIGAIAIVDGSSECCVENVSIAGVSGCGVYIAGSTHNTVRNCIFTEFAVGNQDQSDVFLTNGVAHGSCYNLIEGNQCLGGGWHGVMIETQGRAPGNLYNSVIDNRIGRHLCYGIADYSGFSSIDNFTQIRRNTIEDIQGAVLEGNAGAGIYSVGAGGNIIADNIIRNCCVRTTGATLAPAAIGLSTVPEGLSPVSLVNNIIGEMTRFHGIEIVGCRAGVTVSGNSVSMPASNTTGSALTVNDSSPVTAVGNCLNSLSSQPAILVKNPSTRLTGIILGSNTVRHAAGPGVAFLASPGFEFSQIVINGNQIMTGGAAYSMLVQNFVGAAITGNCCSNAGAAALAMNDCRETRVANNTLTTGARYALAASGACAGSCVDESNYLSGGGGAGIASSDNRGTGLHVGQLGSTRPPPGAGSVGDVVYNTGGGAPFAWRRGATGWSP